MRWRAKPFICFWLSYVFVPKFCRNQHEIAYTVKQIVVVGRHEMLVSPKCQLQTVVYKKFQNASGAEQFSLVQDGIYALGKALMRSAPSLRSFPNVAFEMVRMFV